MRELRVGMHCVAACAYAVQGRLFLRHDAWLFCPACMPFETNSFAGLICCILLRFSFSSGRRDANVDGWKLMALQCEAWGNALLSLSYALCAGVVRARFLLPHNGAICYTPSVTIGLGKAAQRALGYAWASGCPIAGMNTSLYSGGCFALTMLCFVVYSAEGDARRAA